MASHDKRTLGPSTTVFPGPVVLVTCGDGDEGNAITVAWTGIASSEPPCLAIGLRPTRYSFGLIQRYGDFVVNVPTEDQTDILRHCGTVSGRSENKFHTASITPVTAEMVRAPLILEFPVNIECRVKERVALGSHHLFVGEIVAVHADPRVVREGSIDAAALRPVAFFGGEYFKYGDRVGQVE